MKKEHYTLVSEQFNLFDFCNENHPSMWGEYGEDRMNEFAVRVRADGRGWNIIDVRSSGVLFALLPSQLFANNVLAFIKQTQVLFE